MPMLADCVDAVVGVDTHRDTHEVEIAHPTGASIAARTVENDSSGFAELLAWIVEHAPGPRVVVAVEGTRSYGAGLTRAVTAAGLTVIECAHADIAPGQGQIGCDRRAPGLKPPAETDTERPITARPGLTTHRSVYQELYVQSRGALRRELTRHLRTGRALRRPCRAPGQRKKARSSGRCHGPPTGGGTQVDLASTICLAAHGGPRVTGLLIGGEQAQGTFAVDVVGLGVEPNRVEGRMPE